MTVSDTLTLSMFDFHLPESRVAQHPIEPKDAARMLVVDQHGWRDRIVGDLAAQLQPGDILVFNDTRVIPARLTGTRGQARVEVTLHKRVDGRIWDAFARPAKRLRPGDTIRFAEGFSADVVDKKDGGEVRLAFDKTAADLFAALERHGIMPLPPYIKRNRNGDARDRDDYQTMFAARDGAVAAPTAGLHFTPAMIDAIEARGVKTARLTLHVGAGTFLPVKVETVKDHKMHVEWGEIDAEAAVRINGAKAAGGRIVAVGTTSLRLLESATGGDGVVKPFADETDIFITPGYRFRAVDLLLTNFHLPKSTLFMLVCAFSGLAELKAAYGYAIAAAYRFYSYGDCCLLKRKNLP